MSETRRQLDGNLCTVDAPEGVQVKIETDVVARCPVGDGIDRYDVTVQYASAGRSVECASLQEFLDSFVDVAVSQETVTAEIADAVESVLPDAYIRVKTTGQHSNIPLEVTVG